VFSPLLRFAAVRKRFNATWVPRMGAPAAAILYKMALWRASGLPFVLVVALVASARNATLYYSVLVPLTAALVISFVVARRRLSRSLAVALSDYLGLPITTKNLPPLVNPKLFDKAVSNLRDGLPGRERSFFGGFIRIRRP
jgi:hypothetical protein